MKKNNKGFTLMEMLIVVAIIAALVTIIIPTINKSVDKANQAADNANVRSAIAIVSTNYLLGEGDTTYNLPEKMKADWDGTTLFGIITSTTGANGENSGWKKGAYVQVRMDGNGSLVMNSQTGTFETKKQ